MSDKLKKFVDEHRQKFDTGEPGKDLWKKIDVQLDVKNSSRISSNWLSKFKYLGFSASVLVVAVYFITKSLSGSSENSVALNKKDSVLSYPVQYPETGQNRFGSNSGENNAAKEASDLSGNKNKSQKQASASSNGIEQSIQSIHNSLLKSEKDSLLHTSYLQPATSEQEKIKTENSINFPSKEAGETKINPVNEKKENNRARNRKKTELYIPEEPGSLNSYTGTLYESFSFCPVLRAYRFPGKIGMKDGEFHRGSKKEKTKGVLKTISCSHLAGITNIKAIWLKGKTDKKLTISIEKKLRNIMLVKSNGRQLRPEAISHYYPGLGVITEYTGKYLNMVFKDKVELILFFKDAEEGDRILIDGTIEAVIKGQP